VANDDGVCNLPNYGLRLDECTLREDH